MYKALFTLILSLYSLRVSGSSLQDCVLRTHDGKERHGKIIDTDESYWILTSVAKSEKGGWALKYDSKNHIYIYQDSQLFDSIDLFRSVSEDLKKMRTSVSSMQMYFPMSRWWLEHLKKDGITERLNKKLISGLSVAFSPSTVDSTSNDFSVSFKHDKSALSTVNLKKKVQKTRLSLVFDTLSKDEKLDVTWWEPDLSPKSVTWTLGKSVNTLECKKPSVVSKADLPNVTDVKLATSAKRNFLQLVHASSLVNIITQLSEKGRDSMLGLLLTGVCSKHLESVYDQIEKISKNKNTGVVKDSEIMRHIGKEFGEAVSVEFKAYQPILDRKYSKLQIIQSYQANCTDPLGLLIENYSKGDF